MIPNYKNQSNFYAKLGLILLALSPFSMFLSFHLFVAALSIASLHTLIFDHTSNTWQQRAKIDVPYNLVMILFGVALYLFVTGIISILYLFSNGNVDEYRLLWRFGTQFGMFLVSIFTIWCGVQMAIHYDPKTIKQAIITPFFLMIAVCIYQYFSEQFNLPFVGNYVPDKLVGLRPSSLASEPKFLASYFCLIFAFLIFDISSPGTSWATRIFQLSWIGLCAFFFYVAASANGWIGLGILTFFFALRLKWWQQVAIGGVGVFVIGWLAFQINAGEIAVRESHGAIIENITDLDLSFFDDLIVLPLMAWRENLLGVLIGFGPGLLHFFAMDFINYATWFSDENYIDGNLAAIGYISTFGLILYSTVFIIFFRRSLQLMNIATTDTKANCAFFASSFLIGSLIQGNSSVPLFLSIGWIFMSSRMQKTPA